MKSRRFFALNALVLACAAPFFVAPLQAQAQQLDVEILNQTSSFVAPNRLALAALGRKISPGFFAMPAITDVVRMQATLAPPIQSNGTAIGRTLNLAVAPKPNVVEDLFRGTFTTLPPGTYTPTLTATRIRNGAVVDIDQETAPSLVIAPSANCFTFTNDVQGWTASGNYINDEGQVEAQMFNLAASGGSLIVPLGTHQSTSDFPLGAWARVDLDSPSLEGNANWAGLRGFSYRLTSNVLTQVQPLLRVRRPDGVVAFIRELDAQGAPVFYREGEPAVATQALPEGYTLLGLRIRVFRDSVYLNTEAVTRMDNVCPQP